jgi:LysM repeat protein
VADNFGVPPSMVRRWNHLKGDSVRGRRVLYIHLPVAPDTDGSRHAVVSKSKSKKKLQADASKNVVHHKVQRGETLSSIAKSHNTTVDALKEDNGNLANLRPGMVLVIGSPDR